MTASPLRKRGPVWLMLCRRTRENCLKIRRLQARTADKGTADLGNAQDFAGIRWLHRAPVKNAHGCRRAAETIGQATADMGMHLRDVVQCCRTAGADGPDRLVGDRGILRARPVGHAAGELAGADLECLAAFALGLALADADDRFRRETGAVRNGPR
jgi:hypothetical protein